MKVELINRYKDAFKHSLATNVFELEKLHFEVIKNWQATWDIEILDLAENFTRSLSSQISARLWGGSRNSAKSMMVELIKFDKETVRSFFRDLFFDENDVGLRIDRFIYHLDQLFDVYQKKNPQAISHFHDRQTAIFYLSLQYPYKYCYWNYADFYGMMSKLESRNTPSEHEAERYFKSMRAIYGLLGKDEAFTSACEKQLAVVKSPTFLTVMNDFAKFVSQEPISPST